MKTILVVIDHYLPGYKAGGPIRSVANMVEWLGDEFQFRIVTSDRDLGDRQPYPHLKQEGWQPVGRAQVLYLAPREKRFVAWYRLLNALDYDVLYLNSYFSRLSIKTMFLRRLGWIPQRPVVLAPRGEFSPGALSLKGLKKGVYVRLVKCLGLYNDVTWQASSNYEKEQILSIFGYTDAIGTAPDPVAPNLVPKRAYPETSEDRPLKEAGAARIVFLSRISRKKNLDVALDLLSRATGKVQFDIYGPVEDEPYWKECQVLLDRLPSNVQASFKGIAPPDRTIEIFSQYHLFLFPTRGENFGHVIWEALWAGCPVLTSDQTPWRDLARENAGWDIPLSELELFRRALDEMIAMDERAFEEWSRAAQKRARAFADDPARIQANRQLFRNALARSICGS
jgi:glycosyltransferase involved in cell wall biosynthesis